jgi:glycosyltransferase involved in cell wall biosynthesis
VNFTLNDASTVLAHQAAFARRLAARVEAVHVVTELLGEFKDIPDNMSITSIARRPLGVPRRFGSLWFALPGILAAIREFRPDVCFIHMAHEWAYRLGPALKRRGIPMLLWYTHKQVSMRLRLAEKFADRIVAATPDGFRLATKKLRAIGHGIDISRFDITTIQRDPGLIISVGRISRVKRLELIIEALATLRLHPKHANVRVNLIGPRLTPADNSYAQDLEEMADRLGVREHLHFIGPLPQARVADAYRAAALHVNVTNTGGLDKSILEALACGCPVLTCNAAFFKTLEPFPAMQIVAPSPGSLADRMGEILRQHDEFAPDSLRSLIIGHHDLDSHVEKIVDHLADLAAAAHRASGSA